MAAIARERIKDGAKRIFGRRLKDRTTPD